MCRNTDSAHVLHAFCVGKSAEFCAATNSSSQTNPQVQIMRFKLCCEFMEFSQRNSTLMSKLQSKRLISTMNALVRLSLRGGGSIGSQAFSGRAPIRKPCVDIKPMTVTPRNKQIFTYSEETKSHHLCFSVFG